MYKKRRSKEQITEDIASQSKICSVCSIRKPFSDFYNFKNKSDQKGYRCKLCDDLARTSWKKNNPESAQKSSRRRNLLFKYNLSIKDYESLLNSQNNCCAICKTDKPGNLGDRFLSFSVDHNHVTGEIRGLLCNNCNRGLGLLGDTPEAIENVLTYLKETH